jgi:hypothetical protein
MISEIIEEYGEFVENFEASPIKLIEIMRKRSQLKNLFQKLSIDERHKLIGYDLQLIKNAIRMSKQIEKLYEVFLTEEPLSNWWWHLDKVANGEIDFFLCPETTK